MKKIKFILILCFILLLSSCPLGKLHNYEFISGDYISTNNEQINITFYNNGNVEEVIIIDKVSLKLTEITKEEYEQANKNNVIEDLSLKLEKRKYFSIKLSFIIDGEEISVYTNNFRCFSNKKELYLGSFKTDSFKWQNIDLYNYGNQIKLVFNGRSVTLNRE